MSVLKVHKQNAIQAVGTHWLARLESFDCSPNARRMVAKKPTLLRGGVWFDTLAGWLSRCEALACERRDGPAHLMVIKEQASAAV
jgi:hypothetical protein